MTFPLGAVAQPVRPTDEALAERYYENHDYERALQLYERLYRAEPQHPTHAVRVIECLVRLKRTAEALSFVDRSLKRNVNSPELLVQRAELLDLLGQAEAATAQRRVAVDALGSFEQVQQTAALYIGRRRFDWAIASYQRGRQLPGLATAFGPELAMAYSAHGQPDLAAREWLSLAQQTPALSSAARLQILRLTTDANAPAIERVLTQALNAEPDNLNLRELLGDFYIQTENFGAALAQVRVLDRQRREGGQRLYQLAMVLQQNARFDLSNQALEAVIRIAGEGSLAMNALVQRAKNFELSALAVRPVDTLRVARAVAVYDSLFTVYGRPAVFAEALMRKARLCIAHTHDLAEARRELQVLTRLGLSDNRWAEAQLLLGDVLVMQGEYPQARLTYEAVMQRMHESAEAAQAKLADARLAYYKGDFQYARARLQVLKDNAADNVANDAIQLFLFIQDNLGSDSTVAALLPFARAQLLTVQRRFAPALRTLDSIVVQYPGHPITDDVYWQKASIRMAQGAVDDALVAYELLLERYDRSVLADDALMAKAEVYHYYKLEPERAQQLYIDLLQRYPSSLLAVEARRRIRQLRGEPGA